MRQEKLPCVTHSPCGCVKYRAAPRWRRRARGHGIRDRRTGTDGASAPQASPLSEGDRRLWAIHSRRRGRKARGQAVGQVCVGADVGEMANGALPRNTAGAGSTQAHRTQKTSTVYLQSTAIPNVALTGVAPSGSQRPTLTAPAEAVTGLPHARPEAAPCAGVRSQLELPFQMDQSLGRARGSVTRGGRTITSTMGTRH